MVRIIPSRLKSYTGGGGSGTPNSNNSSSAANGSAPALSQKSSMHNKREASPGGVAAARANGLMLRIVVLRVCRLVGVVFLRGLRN